MKQWRTVILACILASAADCRCILLNHAELKALKRQHQLIKEIRERIEGQYPLQEENQPTDELVSQACHTITLRELEIAATVIAAYQSNVISKEACTIALKQAQEYNSEQCEKLAEFWRLTRTIGAMELERFDIFDNKKTK